MVPSSPNIQRLWANLGILLPKHLYPVFVMSFNVTAVCLSDMVIIWMHSMHNQYCILRGKSLLLIMAWPLLVKCTEPHITLVWHFLLSRFVSDAKLPIGTFISYLKFFFLILSYWECKTVSILSPLVELHICGFHHHVFGLKGVQHLKSGIFFHH